MVSPPKNAVKVRAAQASAVARRQSRDLAIELRIQPAHLLTPEQVVAWRRLWRTLLDPIQFVAEQEDARGDQPRANDAEAKRDGAPSASS